jgi:hypothetical protein
MARVIADAVVVREAPGRQSAFIPLNCYMAQPPCGQLFLGQDSGYESVYLLDGPVAADGYDWYLAATDAGGPDPEYIGWIPAGDAAGPWVVGAPPDCPQEPIELADVTLSAMTPLARLTCLSGMELTLRGWFPAPPPPDGVSSETCQVIEEQPMFCGFGYDTLRPGQAPWAGNANYLEFNVETAAGLTQPERPGWVTVRGQVDHPAALECPPRYEGDIGAVLRCRVDFVVTAISSG